MLVLGEKLLDDGATVVEPIGWCAHPVLYDPKGTGYAHATRIGAEVAEREALIWAGIWRLTQNCSTPTVFCCDSLACGNQAFGNIGAGSPDEAYRLLRGIFQCLEHGLPKGHLRLHHIRSHAGDPFNEFVDYAAKREAKTSFHHKHIRIDIPKLLKIFPHLWLIFGHRSGLSVWKDGVLDTSLPRLPSSCLHDCTTVPPPAEGHVKCAVSIATGNVLSLSRGPDGHGGKLHYLFEQMKHFRLNILGLQECRSDERHSTSHKILRYMSGHHKGQGGVELWINLEQPIAHDAKGNPLFLAAHHLQVVLRDPQIY